jgi:hypothetical protein
MLISYNWWLWHAGLMAIAAIGEGMSKVCIFFGNDLAEFGWVAEWCCRLCRVSWEKLLSE